MFNLSALFATAALATGLPGDCATPQQGASTNVDYLDQGFLVSEDAEDNRMEAAADRQAYQYDGAVGMYSIQSNHSLEELQAEIGVKMTNMLFTNLYDADYVMPYDEFEPMVTDTWMLIAVQNGSGSTVVSQVTITTYFPANEDNYSSFFPNANVDGSVDYEMFYRFIEVLMGDRAAQIDEQQRTA